MAWPPKESAPSRGSRCPYRGCWRSLWSQLWYDEVCRGLARDWSYSKFNVGSTGGGEGHSALSSSRNDAAISRLVAAIVVSFIRSWGRPASHLDTRGDGWRQWLSPWTPVRTPIRTPEGTLRRSRSCAGADARSGALNRAENYVVTTKVTICWRLFFLDVVSRDCARKR